MDINQLMQMLGLNTVSGAQAAGLAPAGNLAATPQQDYSRIQKLMQFLRQAQNMPQFNAAKGALQQTGQDVQGMMGQAGQEVSPLVKGIYQRMASGRLPMGSMFNTMVPPMPAEIVNQLMQITQGPQG